MSSNNNNKKKGGKPPTSLSSSNINIPTTRSRSNSNNNNNNNNNNEVIMTSASTTPTQQQASILSSSPSAPIPIPIAKKASASIKNNSYQPNVNSNNKRVAQTNNGNNMITPSSSIGSNSSSIASSPSSLGSNHFVNKPYGSAPSTFGGMLSRMQQQQQHLFKNNNNSNNSAVDSIKSSNSGFLRPVGIPISSSFNQKQQQQQQQQQQSSNNSSTMSSPKISNSKGLLQLSTSSDSSMSTSPNFSTSFAKQSPNSYYSGFTSLPNNNSFSSASPSPSPSSLNLFRRGSPPSIYLKPSPPTSSNNSFLMPSPQSASEVFGSKSSTSSSNNNNNSSNLNKNQPKTKTIGFDIPSSAPSTTTNNKKETTTTTTSTNSPTTPRKKKHNKETIIPAHELEFDSQESDQSDNEDDFDLKEDFSNEEEEEGEVTSPPQKEITAKDNKFFINIEHLDAISIEKMVMEGWKKQIPRFHQKDAVVKILQNIVEQFKIESKKIAPLLSPATPLATPLSPAAILSAPSSTNSDISIASNFTTNTATSTMTGLGINQVIKPVKNAKNYLIQHAAGSGKSLAIACLVYNLYRLLEDGKLKYDLILVLNDKRHLDTQLGSIVTQFLKDNDLKSVIHPSTVRLLKEILSKAKTRVVITTIQKISSIDHFEQTLSKYKSVALITDETRQHGKATKFLNSMLLNENRQNNNITYFCFTCTPTPKCLEMFGDTRGNLRVPFHTYSLEKALQDKVIIDVTTNYTTVSMLTKVSDSSTDNSNSYFLTDEKKPSYHLLKDPQNDKKVIQEKSSFIIKHFLKLKEQMNNKEFTGRAMLVTSNREQLLLYKQVLESIVKGLPKSERFDIIASFFPFEYKKKIKDEADPKINGVYASYCSKRNGISEILRNDTKRKVQLIIVADKLQTGFNEPSLAVMYIDKALKSADAVQTFGRLSRVAKGKSQCYIVDFINIRREVQDAFNQYWRETCLKGATRKTVLEIKLNRILNKLSNIGPLGHGKLQESVDYILQDDEKRKKEKGRYHSITEDITHFVDLCSQLFWDNQPPMNVRFLEAVKFAVCQKRVSTQMHSIRGLLQNIENKNIGINNNISNNGNNSYSSVTSNKSMFGSKRSDKYLLKREEENRILDHFRSQQEDSMDLDAENLEFAREIWSANPEIKLHSRLLGNEQQEEEIDNIGFNLKMFEQAETLEQVIEIVVEFVSRNGPTFEGFIKNQSMSTIFPFIDPNNDNYSLYKQKLDKARSKYNQEQQKLIHQQLQLQREQHHQQQQLLLKEQNNTDDIIMSDISSNNNSSGTNSNGTNSNGQIQFNLKTPWNNQDIPFPVPLPVVLHEQVVGKPHAEGRMDDCLLDDCVLSFCNDLDTKDPSEAPIRVYAIQVLGMLTNKGVHKNQLYEIVGSIHKILLNRQENISLKMIALDLLALVASQDEDTITQIVDFGLIGTIIKLIQTADDPLKAKCCKFFTVLHNDISIVSALIENQGIGAIATLLESYDYIVTEQSLRCLISLAHEDRTVKTIRTSIDPNILARLEHHKIQVIHDLTNQLKTLISGSKRSLQQFQPLISNTKRIRSNSTISTMSISSKLNSKKLLSKSSSNLNLKSNNSNNSNNNDVNVDNIDNNSNSNKNTLSTSQPNLIVSNNDEAKEIKTDRRISTSDSGSEINNIDKDTDTDQDKDKEKDNNKNKNKNKNIQSEKIEKTITKPITRSVLKSVN